MALLEVVEDVPQGSGNRHRRNVVNTSEPDPGSCSSVTAFPIAAGPPASLVLMRGGFSTGPHDARA